MKTILTSFSPKRFLKLTALAGSFILYQPAGAQVWTYDFGTGSSSYSTSGTSTSFLPEAPDGTAMVSIGTGGGSISLSDPGSALGSGTELQLTASSNSTANKTGIYDYTPGLTGFTRLHMRLMNGTSGSWFFYAGNGSSFSSNATISSSEAFAGMRWVIAGDGSVTTSIQSGSGWTDLPSNTFQQGQDYVVEIFTNNSEEPLYYDKNGPWEIPAGMADIWVNHIQIADDVTSVGLPASTEIDSWTLYGTGSSSNTSQLYMDNITFTNDMTLKVLPVRFANVRGNMMTQSNRISFDNLTESSVVHYVIERSANGSRFGPISTLSPTGNHGMKSSYVFSDAAPVSGMNFYRVKATEQDGKVYYSDIIRINRSGKTGSLVYPNPTINKSFTVELTNVAEGNYSIAVFNALLQQKHQQMVYNPGQSFTEKISLPSTLPKGLYLVQVRNADGPVMSQWMMVE